MKKTLFVFLTVVMLLGAVSAGAMAMGGRPGFNGPHGQGFGFNDKALNLSVDQQQKLLAIRQDFQKEAQTLRFEMQKKQLELRQLWTAKPLDQAAIDTKVKEVTALRIQLVTKAQNHLDQVKSVLTPAQLKKFESLKGKFGPGMMGQGRRGEQFRGGCFGNRP